MKIMNNSTVVSQEELKDFGWSIQALIEKKDLSRTRCYEMFRSLLTNRQPDLQQGAFLAALAAKGETPDEIAGAWEAIVEFDTNRIVFDTGVPLVENSGTGMDRLKTFNVSSAAAIVAASAGVRMARHGSRALTSSCGTVDLLEAAGVDVECPVNTVGISIEQVGIGLFNGMSPAVHPKALARILSRIRFGSTLNIAASLASPIQPTHALRGVYAPEAISSVCEVMKRIGYRRAMVVHGFDREKNSAIDELSNIGESQVTEFFPDGAQTDYRIHPNDFGLKTRTYENIAALGNVKKEAVRFLQTLAGVDHPACQDITCLNAAAILYVSGKEPNMAMGLERAREMIADGRAISKLAQWVATQTRQKEESIRRLVTLASAAGVMEQVQKYLP